MVYVKSVAQHTTAPGIGAFASLYRLQPHNIGEVMSPDRTSLSCSPVSGVYAYLETICDRPRFSTAREAPLS